MDKLFSVVMGGATQIEMAIAANTHNLANVNTPGFRAELTAFEANQQSDDDLYGRVSTESTTVGLDDAAGTIFTTGRNLDIAIQDKGWIAVAAPDGTEAYTRRGDLHISPNGILHTGDGHPVLGNNGPITIPPHEKLEIAMDGTLSIRPLGQGAETMATIDRIRLTQPDETLLRKQGDGLLHLPEEAVAEPDANVRIISGSLENSNVNAIEALVTMISLARSFETQIRLMRDASENDSSSAQIMRMR